MKLHSIGALISLLVTGNVLGQQGFRISTDSSSIEIPFEFQNNLIVLEVILNDYPLKLILDSNVEYPILTQKSIGDQLGLNYTRKIPLGKVNGETNYGYASNGAQLKLNGGVQTGANHSILVLEQDHMNLSSLARAPVHGLIGFDLFGFLVVEINQTKRRLVLHNPDHFESPRGYDKIPLVLAKRNCYVNTSILFENWERKNSNLQIKTGAVHTILFSGDSTYFLLPSHNLEIPLGVGPGGRVEGHIGRVREFMLGKYRMENPLASFTKSQYSETGSIGMGILSRFDVVFDYSRETLYLKKNKDFSRSFEYDMSGVTIEATGPSANQFLITNVLDNSPAKRASVQVGDQVIAINGKKISPDNLDELLAPFSNKPGKTIELTMLKNNEEVKITFRLARMI